MSIKAAQLKLRHTRRETEKGLIAISAWQVEGNFKDASAEAHSLRDNIKKETEALNTLLGKANDQMEATKKELKATKLANDKLTQALSEYRGASSNSIKHIGLLAAIAECYKQRKLAEYREYGAALSPYYLSLFEALESNSKEKGVGFMHLSTLLNDCGEFDGAVDMCQKAINYGLTDGTVTGFEGRIIRIEKAKAKSLK